MVIETKGYQIISVLPIGKKLYSTSVYADWLNNKYVFHCDTIQHDMGIQAALDHIEKYDIHYRFLQFQQNNP